jgi:hypothetical protein
MTDQTFPVHDESAADIARRGIWRRLTYYGESRIAALIARDRAERTK